MENVLACLFLKIKEGNGSTRTHLHIFIKFIIKNQRKKNSEIADEKKRLKQYKKLNWKLQ